MSKSNNVVLVGGQAVIEGVMMRVPGAYATAVRRQDGSIEVDRHQFTSLLEKKSIFRLPIIRGVITLFEALKIGLSTLQFSADIAMEDEAQESGKEYKSPSKLSNFLTILFAFFLGIFLFAVAPLYITTKVFDVERTALSFNLISGVFRIIFFLIYLIIISLMKDVKRLFQYHGAEHKTVYNFESGQELQIENARHFSTYHPRCGTSFLFIVLIASILLYALIDTLILAIHGNINLLLRLMIHIPLIPLVAGVSYELVRLTARYQHLKWVYWLALPGLWLQYITTKEPDQKQLEVAIIALKAAFGDNLDKYTGKRFIARAID